MRSCDINQEYFIHSPYFAMGFEGKVILITGGGSGIGADAARHLAKLGAKVAIVDMNSKRLDDVAEVIKKSGSPTPLPIVADVTKDAERIVSETIEHFGQLDVLINNAGIPIGDTVVDVDLSEFDRVFSVNLRAVINLTKLCIPHLEKTEGNIVNVASICGLRPVPSLMTYCMSKAALIQFTKCAALDLAPKKIRVNGINPGVIRTNIFEPMGLTSKQVEQALNDAKSKHPIGRIGEVSDTSPAISFLADNNLTSFLTGQFITVDGGSMLVGP